MAKVLVERKKLKQLIINKLNEVGLKEEHSITVSDVLVHADLRGVHSHGALRTEHYVKRIKKGGINKNPSFKFVETGPCTAILDGDDGMGHIVLKEAMDKGVETAKKYGIGMIGVKNSSHCGALSYFVKQATENNMIGIIMTHTDSGVVPFGGAEPYFGTNPIAFGFPAKENKPIILDMATSNVAFGKVFHARELDENIPDDWGVDKKGLPTIDPNKIISLLPFGGPKGYGLAMIVDILSGILTNSPFGPHISPMYDRYEKMRKLGHFVMVINPSNFTSIEKFLLNVDQMINEIHSIQPMKGFDKVMVPGEPEQLYEQEYQKKGIPVTSAIYNFLTK